MISEISGALNFAGTTRKWFEKFNDFDAMHSFVRDTDEIVKQSDIQGMDSEKRQLRDLVAEGDAISLETPLSSIYRRMSFTDKIAKSMKLWFSLLSLSAGDQQLKKSAKLEAATERLLLMSSKMLEIAAEEQLMMSSEVLPTLKRIADQQLEIMVAVREIKEAVKMVMRQMNATDQPFKMGDSVVDVNKMSQMMEMTPAPWDKMVATAAMRPDVTEMVSDPQFKALADSFTKIERDRAKFGFKESHVSGRLTMLKFRPPSPVMLKFRPSPPIMITTSHPLQALGEMIFETGKLSVNFHGPPWCGKDHIIKELVKDPKMTEIYGGICSIDVNETPNIETLISKVSGILNYGGEVEGIGLGIKANDPILLILDNFPPNWERDIEKLAFLNAGGKLLLVSDTKLSSVISYGLDHAKDADEQRFRLFSPDLNEGPYNFDYVKDKFVKDGEALDEDFEASSVFMWKKCDIYPSKQAMPMPDSFKAPKLSSDASVALDVVKAPKSIFKGETSASSTPFVLGDGGAKSYEGPLSYIR